MNELFKFTNELDTADDGVIRTYQPGSCVMFRKTNERFGGLSNMASGFALDVNGVRIRTSEALYQALRFPHLPELQQLIIKQASPMAAKMKGKPHRANSRSDWDSVRVPLMRWCLRVKLANNIARFGALLRETGDKAIVEDSHKDDFWGAKRATDGTLVGRNVLGRLLVELRELVRCGPIDSFRSVPAPPVPGCLLFGNLIRSVGPETCAYVTGMTDLRRAG
jgi:type I restriction enzyme S subunit